MQQCCSTYTSLGCLLTIDLLYCSLYYCHLRKFIGSCYTNNKHRLYEYIAGSSIKLYQGFVYLNYLGNICQYNKSALIVLWSNEYLGSNMQFFFIIQDNTSASGILMIFQLRPYVACEQTFANNSIKLAACYCIIPGLREHITISYKRRTAE